MLDTVPIHFFVEQKYHTPQIQKIVGDWRVEPHVVVEKLVEHFREMGIFNVPGPHEKLIVATILFHLRHSPEILRLVTKAHHEEARRIKNRHSE